MPSHDTSEDPESAENAVAPFDAGPFAAYWNAVDLEKMFNQQVDLFKSFGEIAMGSSTIEADKKDRRFDDEAWTTNPFYSRLKQAYLAMSGAIENMVPDNLPNDEKVLAELVASILASAISPTNTLLGNPAAIAKTIETKGANLTKGYQNFLHDMHANGGMPSQVDSSGFEVGRNMAVTPGKIVLRTEMFELIHYAPSTDSVFAIPVLLIPPQIGRYYFTDLAPGRSFAEYTVAQGLQYFAISWRNPTAENSDWGIEAYLASALEAIAAVTAITRQKKINLVGFCAGGILSALAASHLKAKKKNVINSFTLCVTMLDVAADSVMGAFRLPMVLDLAQGETKKKGILPGEELSKVFTWLRPNELVWNYWVNNYLMGEAPPAFDILAWNTDSTNLPAKLHEDFLALFKRNALVNSEGYRLLDEQVDIGRIDCDAFVVGAVTDHLTPWKACYESAKLLGTTTTFALSNGGHVAALVNPPANPKAFHWIGTELPEDPDAWLEATAKRGGSWWESWTKWCSERSGKQVPAPKDLGSPDFPPLDDAPGRYVHEASDRLR